jgi:hypothetical protein
MTLSVFPRTNTSATPVNDRRASTGGVVSKVGRLLRTAVGGIGAAIVMLVAYRAARNRLEARIQGELFDDPVLWAEVKSVAWAEAADAVRASQGPSGPGSAASNASIRASYIKLVIAFFHRYALSARIAS